MFSSKFTCKTKKRFSENDRILFRHDVYNRLGSLTLTQDTTTWPKVRKFLNQISLKYPHALVADVGMSNTRYSNESIEFIQVVEQENIFNCNLIGMLLAVIVVDNYVR